MLSLLGLLALLPGSLVVLAGPAAQASPARPHPARLAVPRSFAALQADLTSGRGLLRAGNTAPGVPLPTAPAGASGGNWRIEPTPNPVHLENGVLAGVSCASTTACIAVGNAIGPSGHTVLLTESWNGTAWTARPAPSPAGAVRTQLSGVSCLSASACTAVGQYVSKDGQLLPLAEAWNGTTWRSQVVPAPKGANGAVLFGVSCTSASACTAVGDWAPTNVTTPFAARWNGTAWTLEKTPTIAPPGDNSGLFSVSCSTATACTAVGATETNSKFFSVMAESWNGTTWRTTGARSPAGSTDDSLMSVSCTAASACVAVGFDFGEPGGLAESWNGSAWTIQPTPASSAGQPYLFAGVSCTSPQACIAVGENSTDVTPDTPTAAVWNGTTWSFETTPEPPGGVLNTVACTAASACMAAGTSGASEAPTLAMSLSGTTWTQLATPNVKGADNSFLNAVSCGSPSACVAVGGGDYEPPAGNSFHFVATAQSWNGTAWRAQKVPVPAHRQVVALNGASCGSATACVAVGDAGSLTATAPLAEAWNGTSWAMLPIPGPAGARTSSLAAVSCTSPTSCVAVGEEGIPHSGTDHAIAETWNGTSWTLQTVPEPPHVTGTEMVGVSCTAPNACIAVGNFFSKTQSGRLAEAWNGTTWTILTTAAPATSGLFLGVSCASASACMAVGTASHSGGGESEFWNGSTWTAMVLPLPFGDKDAQPNAVSCASATNCTAVGFSRTSPASVSIFAMADTWNGKGWAAAHTPNPPVTDGSQLLGVSCIPAGGCTAVGAASASDAGLNTTLAIAN